MSALLDAVRTLAATRDERFVLDQAVKDMRAAWEAEHAGILAAQKEIAAREAREAEAVKALAGVAFRETGDVKPAPGVAVKMFATMAYDADAALAWARQAKMALTPESLDVSAFEKIAKATKLPFVRYGSEPRIQIAKDLANALPAEEVVS